MGKLKRKLILVRLVVRVNQVVGHLKRLIIERGRLVKRLIIRRRFIVRLRLIESRQLILMLIVSLGRVRRLISLVLLGEVSTHF